MHLGENQIDGFTGSILVEELVTQVSLKCYKISSKMEMGTAEMVCNTIKMNITKEMSMHDRVWGYKMKVASEKNIYGSLINDNFLEGDFVDIKMPTYGVNKVATFLSLSQKNNQYLPETSNCTEKSIYHCMADKAMEMVMDGECSKKCIPPFYKNILELAKKQYKLDLCQEFQENKCIGEKITLRLQEAARLEECPRSCTQIDYYANVLHSNAIDRFWPEDMNKEICYSFATTIVKVDEEYLIYGFADMVGSVGGSLGMFLGFSLLDQLFSLLEMIQNRVK